MLKNRKYLIYIVVSLIGICIFFIISAAVYWFIIRKNKPKLETGSFIYEIETTNDEEDEAPEDEESLDDEEPVSADQDYTEEEGVTNINVEKTEVAGQEKYSVELTGNGFNMAFTYPKFWGDVEGYIYDGGYCPTGSRFSVTFDGNPFIRITGASKDCSYQGGDVCPIYDGFNGVDNLRESFCNYDLENFDPGYYNSRYHFACEDLNLGKESMSYYYGPSYACAGYLGFRKIVVINTTMDDFTGMIIDLNVITHEDGNLAARAKEAEIYYGLTNEYPENEYYKDYENNRVEEYAYIFDVIKDSLEDTSKASYITRNQIIEFDEFIETIQFNGE